MQPWDRRQDETGTAYERFVVYLRMGADRSLRAVAEELGKGHNYVRTLERWSSHHDWVARAEAYDLQELEESIKTRRLVIERARQDLLAGVGDAIDVLLSVAQDHEAAPTARVSAAREVLDRAGVTSVKKVELSGPEGGSIPIQATMLVQDLDLATLEALDAELEGAGE